MNRVQRFFRRIKHVKKINNQFRVAAIATRMISTQGKQNAVCNEYNVETEHASYKQGTAQSKGTVSAPQTRKGELSETVSAQSRMTILAPHRECRVGRSRHERLSGSKLMNECLTTPQHENRSAIGCQNKVDA